MATTKQDRTKTRKLLLVIFLYSLTAVSFVTTTTTTIEEQEDFLHLPTTTSNTLPPYPKRNQNSLLSKPSDQKPGGINHIKSNHDNGVLFRGIFDQSDKVLSESESVNNSDDKILEPYPKRSSSSIFSGIFTDPEIHQRRNRRETKNMCAMEQCSCTQTRGNHFNITCNFDNRENVVIDLSTLPDTTSELNIKGNPGRVTVSSPVFSSMSALDLLSIAGATLVTFRPGGGDQRLHTSLGSPAVRLAVHNCADVKVERRALKVNKKQVIHVEMVDVSEIKIAGDAFEYLQNATFRNVSRMVLESRSFAYSPVASRQGATTTMFFQNVIFDSIPRDTFVNPADEIQMINCDIPVIKERAFSAPMYHSVLLRNSSIRRIELGAFAANTLVQKLSVVSCVIRDVGSGAFQAASNRLIFVKNRVTNLHTNSLNVTAATLDFSHNIIERCHRDSLSIREWSNITINGNMFEEISGRILEPDHHTTSSPSSLTLRFTDNSIRKISDFALRFLYEKPNIETTAANNYFEEKCGCEIGSWLGKKLGNGHIKHVQEFQKSSYCTIDAMLARCMNVHDGNVLIQTYLDKICVPAENIQCVPFSGELLVENDQVQNPRFPNKQTGDESNKYELILWISLGTIGILLALAMILIISLFVCRKKTPCCRRDRDSLGSAPASDIVAQMNTAVQETSINETNQAITRTEEEGQLYPLLTNERLQELTHRCNSDDQAVRKAACEEIVKLYQTIKRQNNNELGSTTRATNTDLGLYETIEDALNRRPPPDLLESAVTTVTVPVNDYAQPKDSLPLSTSTPNNGSTAAVCYAVGNCYRTSEYSVPDITGPALGVSGIIRQLEQNSSSPIPYMDATLNSNGSFVGGSDVQGVKMVNRPLPKTPNDNNK